jgi:hypothetical protein
MGQITKLPIPLKTSSAEKAVEIARIWAAGGKQHVSFAAELWKDPAAWGLMLVDLARHVANAYAQREGQNPVEVLARIREGFDVEWDNPTDTPTGNISN